MHERRQFSRVPFNTSVSLQQGSESVDTQLVDISLNGVLIATPSRYRLATDRQCTIVVPLADDVRITMQVALVHSSSNLLGFHCTGMDMESMSHLRRLIEMNLHEQGAAERVLAEMLGQQTSV